jgi:hypothetical protein
MENIFLVLFYKMPQEGENEQTETFNTLLSPSL